MVSSASESKTASASPALSIQESDTTMATFEPLTEFTLFPKLHTELRLMIWKHAFPGPRLIKLTLYKCYEVDEYSKSKSAVQNNEKQSALLRACHESRQVYIKASQDSLKVNWPLNVKQPSNKILFNQNSDMVYLSKLFNLFNMEDEERVRFLTERFPGKFQHVAMTPRGLIWFQTFGKIATRILLKEVKTLTIVLTSEIIHGTDLTDLVELGHIDDQNKCTIDWTRGYGEDDKIPFVGFVGNGMRPSYWLSRNVAELSLVDRFTAVKQKCIEAGITPMATARIVKFGQ